ncbi:site-2 protease family protein [Anaerofustis stercorihominis]|uniref:Peptidase, M50 family n=3 Tax=Anaerofustis stercorihominis TaxID=214853 RepID=B1C6S8_9FIRM|nr:site-2 protease family protein [Anaerofustis stercorihominis]EDS72715.1 peptidase, M50 family [Anaerofustis stercorihominis DSM 17244]MCQ4794089.1 site-2 protease family protein [Anaerofustis stercorihominis]
MSLFSTERIIQMLYMLVPIILALSFHEFAHAYVADKLGDPTARVSGRMTLDPTKHLDPIGFVSLLLFGFGWARPVPFNPMNLKKRKSGTLLISLAGPLSNLILAVIFSVLLRFVIIPINNEVLTYIFYYGVIINISLMAFNLIPVPPLDGSKILASLLPDRLEMKFYQYEHYLYLLLILLLITGIIGYILSPIMAPFLSVLLP